MSKTIDSKFASRVFTGGPVITISTVSKDGISDAMTAAWSTNFDSDEILLVLDKGHTTVQNILDTGKAVVALPSKEHIKDILAVGSVHGRDVGDKFDSTKVEFELSDKYQYKIIKSPLAYLEGVVTDKELLKDKGICILKIENLVVADDLWDDKEEHFGNGAKLEIHHVTGGKFITLGQIVG